MPDYFNTEAAKRLFARQRQNQPNPPQQPVPKPEQAAAFADGALAWIPNERLQDHPRNAQIYRPATPERLEELRQDIAANGIISPLVVRPLPDGAFQILVGHNRRKAALQAGYRKLPCIVRRLEEDAAFQLMVADNLLHRPNLLPSEKAYAYKARADFASKQGQRTDLTSGTQFPKLTAEEVGEENGLSGRQINKYIRLTYLSKALLDQVDDAKLGLTPAVELSYISRDSQALVLRHFFTARKDGTHRLDEKLAKAIRDLDADGMLTEQSLAELSQKSPGSRAPRVLKLPIKELRELLPDTPPEELIEKILFAVRTVYGEHQ